jgi:hypothetical protein
MKKLLAALVLGLGTVAAAQQAQQQPQQQQPQQQQPQGEQGRDISTGIDATEVGPGLKEAVGLDTEKEGTFQTKQAYDLRGTLKSADSDDITIARQGLPNAGLEVRKETRVMLDGKRVEVDAIPEGTSVRVKFQLEEDDPVAVEIRATSPKQKTPAGRSTGQKMKQDAKQMKQDIQQGAQEAKEDVRKGMQE